VAERDLGACSLTLLGGFGLQSADGKELALSTRKDRLLLAYLALNSGRPLARDRLAGLLWGDRGETQARDSLRQSLAAIRQAFRQAGLDPVTADRETVTFDPAGIHLDAADFARLAPEQGTCGRAIPLYRGDLLDGIDGATPEFEAWLRPERERLAGIAIRLVDTAAARGQQSDSASHLAQHLLSRDRLCEPVYRALMRLHVAGGDRAAALKLYATCRDTLKQELSITPDLQTETLYRDILTERPAASDTAAEPVSDKPSIAVLPFDNLSRDSDIGHLCEGIAEDITTGLGRFKLLFVIDRHSSATIAKQTSDVVEVGKRLGVAQVVQGSLQRQGEHLRITVRLVDAATRAQVWSEAFDCPLSDIVSLPDRITGAIVSTLYDRVESALLDKSRRKPTLAAYECVLRGIRHLRGYEPDDNQRAVDLFQQAVDLDPDYALALAYRGFADVVLHHYDDSPPEILASSRDRALAAVRMDPENSRCHWLLGLVVGYAGDLQAEERHYLRALALNPNDANILATYAGLLAALGRIEEGLDRMREAMRRNPYHPEWYWVDLAIIFYIAGRYEDALEAYRRRTNPGYWVMSRIAACYAQMGRMEEAKAAAAEVLRMKPDFSIMRLRRSGWNNEDVEHIRSGMRKAGLPD
jgi:TolB-like protein